VSHPFFFVAPLKQAATNMSEATIQSKAFQNLWNSRPDLRGRIFAINNNSINGIKGAMNKAMGVVAGVADMCYLKPEGKTC